MRRTRRSGVTQRRGRRKTAERFGAELVAAALVAAALISVATPAAGAEPDDDDFASIQLTADDWTWEIVVYDGRGGSRRTPIDLPVIGRPALSPDGTQIAFTSWVTDETDGRWGLYLADVDGSNVRAFTTPKGVDRDPAWSPDGRFIAFSRDTVGSTIRSNCCHIRIKAVAGGSNEMVPGTTGGINPDWSPDGRQLVYERPNGVHVTDTDGTGSYRLTGAGGTDPAWSPDGDEIVYVRPNFSDWELVVRPAEGGDDRVRVRSARRLEDPQWDPDGATLYYVRFAGEGYDGRSETAVWMQRGNRNPSRLFKTTRPIVHLSHRANLSSLRCDFDADGRSDLAIGIPGESVGPDTATGAVGVLYGANAGLVANGDQWWSQALDAIKGAAADDNRFGAAVACGDFDGDGDADLVAGAPGDGPGAGAVTVVLGTPNGLTASGDQRWTQDSDGILGRAEPGHAFGSALATGDIDADGYDDLAIGIPGDKTTAGAVGVLYGRASGLSSAGDERWHQDIAGVPGASKADHAFGAAVAIADFDADGFDDLAVGVPGDINSAGSTVVLYGTASGLDAADVDRWHQDVAGLAGRLGWEHAFGAALAAGDFDRDGYDDLAIGIPGDKKTAGAVNVLYGGVGGLGVAGDQRWHHDTPGILGVSVGGNVFGSALFAADFDGDGYDDLAVGSPGDKFSKGTVAVIYGSSGGLTNAGDQRWHQDATGIEDASENGDAYGDAL